jgi:transcriptional regulator with XRE-family HTH domain
MASANGAYGQRRAREAVGARIRKVRKASGVSRACLAEKLGIDVSVLCRIENGAIAVSVERLLAIAGALHVGAESLLGVRRDVAS